MSRRSTKSSVGTGPASTWSGSDGSAQRDRGQQVGPDVEGQHLEHRQRQRELPARHRPHRERRELGDVVGQVVGEELADVEERARPYSTAATIVSEVVVEQDEVGDLARHVGARAPDRDPDVGAAERRPVVDAVAGHRHDVSPAAPRAMRLSSMRRSPRRACRGAPRAPLLLREIGADVRSPTSLTMAAAVAGWSPVLMATLMPNCRHCSSAAATWPPGGSWRPTSPHSARSRLGRLWPWTGRDGEHRADLRTDKASTAVSAGGSAPPTQRAARSGCCEASFHEQLTGEQHRLTAARDRTGTARRQ